MQSAHTKLSETIGFFVLLAATIIVVLFVIWPFWHVIALAAILSVLFLPVHYFFLRIVKRDSIAALITIIIILLIVIIPLYFLIRITAQEAVSFYTQYNEGGLRFDPQLVASHLPAAWQDAAVNGLNTGIAKVGEWVGAFSIDIGASISNITDFILSAFLIFLTTFFFMRDNKKIVAYAGGLLPLPSNQKDFLAEKTSAAITGVMRGSFLTALIQGAAATVGFLLAGLPQAFFLGFATVFAAFVPMVGIGLIMVPTILYLLITNAFTPAIILIAWYIVPATIDNVVSPYLIGSRTKIYPLAVLFSALGGIVVFGPLGFLFGPIIMAICVALIAAYRREYHGKHEAIS